MTRIALAVVFATSAMVGCAMDKAGAPASPAAQPAQQGGYPASAAPSQPSPYAQPPPPPPAPEPPKALPGQPAQPGGGAEGPPGVSGRSMALQSASNDVEASQRELDVAAGDCRNACRALGSMDRAAGKVCELAQGPDEGRRCDDAKRRVYSARDRVKTTCGACPNGPSVERTAPIPSLR